MTITGETVFTIEGEVGDAVRYAFKPLPPGEVEGEFDFTKAKVRRAESSGAYRISCGASIVGSGKDGKKDRLVFHDFHLTLKPGKDGVVMWRRANQLLGLYRALGKDIKKELASGDVQVVTLQKDEDSEEFQQLNPKQMLQKLRDLGTVRCKMRIKIEYADKNDKTGQNKIDFFIAPQSKGDFDFGDNAPNKNATDVSTDAFLEEK